MPYQPRNRPLTYLGGFPFQGSVSVSNMAGSQLQSTISAATSGTGELPEGVIHHPITCSSTLRLNDEGVFSCEHFSVPPDDVRTKACTIHSFCFLLIEEAFKFTGMKELPYERYE